MCSDVKNYFDNSAAQYTERSSSPLWRWQRSRELSAVSIFLGEIKGIDVLDLGCGAGFYTRFCIEGGARKVISVDFSSQMVDQLPKGRVMPIVSEAEKVKLDCRVAKIICAGLLEFVTCPLDVLTNARNLIASDGFMVCLVPSDNLTGLLYRKFHRSNGVNITLFSDDAFGKLVRDSGWVIDGKETVFPYTSVYRLKVDVCL